MRHGAAAADFLGASGFERALMIALRSAGASSTFSTAALAASFGSASAAAGIVGGGAAAATAATALASAAVGATVGFSMILSFTGVDGGGSATVSAGCAALAFFAFFLTGAFEPSHPSSGSKSTAEARPPTPTTPASVIKLTAVAAVAAVAVAILVTVLPATSAAAPSGTAGGSASSFACPAFLVGDPRLGLDVGVGLGLGLGLGLGFEGVAARERGAADTFLLGGAGRLAGFCVGCLAERFRFGGARAIIMTSACTPSTLAAAGRMIDAFRASAAGGGTNASTRTSASAAMTRVRCIMSVLEAPPMREMMTRARN